MADAEIQSDEKIEPSLLGQETEVLKETVDGGPNAELDGASATQATGGEVDPGKAGEAGVAKGEGENAVAGAPEQYEAFALPQGINASDEQLSEFSDVARELNLPQRQAQRLIEFEAHRMTQLVQSQVDGWENQKSQWVEQLRADPEIGGNDLLTKMATAVRAVHRVGGDALVQALDDTGAGNHPELVRAFYRIGLAMTEDHFSGSGEPLEVGGKKTRAQIMYGDQDG